LIGIFRRGDGRQDRLQGRLRLLGGEFPGQRLDRLREGLKLKWIFRRGDGRQHRLQGRLRLLSAEFSGQRLDRLREGLKLIGIFRRADGRQDRRPAQPAAGDSFRGRGLCLLDNQLRRRLVDRTSLTARRDGFRRRIAAVLLVCGARFVEIPSHPEADIDALFGG